MVVLFHFRGVLNNVYAQKDLGNLLFKSGEIGVDAFFIISGFIICLSTNRQGRIKDFIFKRFFRIYPAYLFFAIIALSLSYIQSSLSSSDIIDALLILPRDYSKGSPFFGYSFIVVAWSLFYEIAFYFLFMISMMISHKHRTIICTILILSCVYIPQIINGVDLTLSPLESADIESLKYLSIFTSPMMVTFIIGMAIYEAIPAMKYISSISSECIIKSAFWASAIYFIYCFMVGINTWHGVTNSVVFIAPFIICSLLYEMKIGLSFKALPSFFGDISYSLYLCHIIVLHCLIAFGGDFYFSSNGFSRFFILVSISLIVSYVSYKAIEKPSSKLCRYILSK